MMLYLTFHYRRYEDEKLHFLEVVHFFGGLSGFGCMLSSCLCPTLTLTHIEIHKRFDVLRICSGAEVTSKVRVLWYLKFHLDPFL